MLDIKAARTIPNVMPAENEDGKSKMGGDAEGRTEVSFLDESIIKTNGMNSPDMSMSEKMAAKLGGIDSPERKHSSKRSTMTSPTRSPGKRGTTRFGSSRVSTILNVRSSMNDEED